MRALCGMSIALAATGCVDYLDAGEHGTARYVADVRGEAPLRLLPPIADREGNIYVLYGAPALNETTVYVGGPAGGWSDGCSAHEGDSRGVHGFVGRGQRRAWYWSGDALVEVDGRTGECEPVLDRDPGSNADLDFLGVAPLVTQTPSRTSVPALIGSAADRVPFHVSVDLDRHRFEIAHSFEPANATDVAVLGTGADADEGLAFMLVRYRVDGALRVEGLHLDRSGAVLHRAPVEGVGDAPAHAIRGYLHSVDEGAVVGLLDARTLVVFNRERGGTQVLASDAVGVHRWDDRLFVVGADAVGPTCAPIDRRGAVGPAVLWTASAIAADTLPDPLYVLDDRGAPRETAWWAAPRPALGAWPFVHPHGPAPYAIDTAGWLVAGPSYQAGGERHTAVAFVPMGVSYP